MLTPGAAAQKMPAAFFFARTQNGNALVGLNHDCQRNLRVGSERRLHPVALFSKMLVEERGDFGEMLLALRSIRGEQVLRM